MASLPVRVYGMGSDGKPFIQDSVTVDITRDGAQVTGVPQLRTCGETVGVQYAEEKARFKVMWVGEPGSQKNGCVGLQAVESAKCPWSKVLDAAPEQFRWTDVGHDRDHSAKPAPRPSTGVFQEDISARVEQSTRELKEIERLIEGGAVEARILREFREAVNHVRLTN